MWRNNCFRTLPIHVKHNKRCVIHRTYLTFLHQTNISTIREVIWYLLNILITKRNSREMTWYLLTSLYKTLRGVYLPRGGTRVPFKGYRDANYPQMYPVAVRWPCHLLATACFLCPAEVPLFAHYWRCFYNIINQALFKLSTEHNKLFSSCFVSVVGRMTCVLVKEQPLKLFATCFLTHFVNYFNLE